MTNVKPYAPVCQPCSDALGDWKGSWLAHQEMAGLNHVMVFDPFEPLCQRVQPVKCFPLPQQTSITRNAAYATRYTLASTYMEICADAIAKARSAEAAADALEQRVNAGEWKARSTKSKKTELVREAREAAQFARDEAAAAQNRWDSTLSFHSDLEKVGS